MINIKLGVKPPKITKAHVGSTWNVLGDVWLVASVDYNQNYLCIVDLTHSRSFQVTQSSLIEHLNINQARQINLELKEV